MGASERDEAARARWREAMSPVDVRRLVFVDESGTHTGLVRLFAWAPRGQRAALRLPRNHGQNTTLLAALTWQGLQAPWTVEGAIDTPAGETYVREVLVPILRPGQIAILDNLSVHKSAAIQQVIEAHGCQLVFLPASSPDLTPIEQAFSNLKAILRRLAARTRAALLDALATALDAITPEDAHACFRHAGYTSLAQAP